MIKRIVLVLFFPLFINAQHCDYCIKKDLKPGLYSDLSNKCKNFFLPIYFENEYLKDNPAKLNTIKIYTVSSNKKVDRIHVATIRVTKEKRHYEIDLAYHIGINKFDTRIVPFDTFVIKEDKLESRRCIEMSKTCLRLNTSLDFKGGACLRALPFKYDNCWYTLCLPEY
jgi:hypothetical protein